MRLLIGIVLVGLLAAPVVAEEVTSSEVAFAASEFRMVVGPDAIFLASGKFQVVPLADLTVRGNHLVVKQPMRSELDTPGLGVKSVVFLSSGSSPMKCEGRYDRTLMGIMPLSTSAPTAAPAIYSSSYTDRFGITHTVMTPRKKYQSGWEKPEAWADRHHAAVTALIAVFPPSKKNG